MDSKKGIYLPQINDYCNDCGVCLKICPGIGVDFFQLDKEIFGNKPDDILIGNYINIYTGYSSDDEIRYNSSSGGLITQLLVFALERGMINGALVTRMKKDKPLEPESFIARTSKEIISAMGSKYCPVPANIALQEIINSKDGEEFAVVGLPCHMNGIRKAEYYLKNLSDKIVLHLGIVCNHTPNYLATEFLLKTNNLNAKEIGELKYRGYGWPGSLRIHKTNGSKVLVPYFSTKYAGIMFDAFFFPERCTLCSDKICQLADITLADAWIQDLIKLDTPGYSLIVVRNEQGNKIIDAAMKCKVIELRNLNSKTVIESQKLDINCKRVNARILLACLIGHALPIPNRNTVQPGFADYCQAILFYFKNFISSKRYLWWIISAYCYLLVKAASVKSGFMHIHKCKQ
jgi:coenzyme F420 hydrogenase subunit beta